MSAPTILPTRRLGSQGPQVTGMGFGMMGLSFGYGTPKPDSERLALLDACYEMGERFWDSADLYGDSEDLLGKWFAANPEKRKDVFLATKFGNISKDGKVYYDSSPEYCKQALEKSLSRLGLPSIDLYYCHRVDKKTPIEKTVKAMAELKAAGKIKYMGLSEVSATSLRRACAITHIDAVQIEYSPWTLDIEKPEIALLKTCRELGVATVAYSPMGRGMLTGTIRSRDDIASNDWRKMMPRFSEENFANNFKLVETIAGIAKKKGVKPSQLTLAWLMMQGDDIIPIPGTTSIERMRENLGALHVKLSAEEGKEIRQACEAAEVHGARYPAFVATSLFADTPELTAST